LLVVAVVAVEDHKLVLLVVGVVIQMLVQDNLDLQDKVVQHLQVVQVVDLLEVKMVAH